MIPMEQENISSYRKTIVVAAGITVILTIFVIVHYIRIAGRPGTILLPNGSTYLGPNAPRPEADQPLAETGTTNVFTAAADTPWHEVKGNIYPYVMSIPTTLTLVAPEGSNSYDIYAISWGGYDTNSTVLIGVDDLTNNPNTSKYINQPKPRYVNAWWRQFGGLTGVASINQFTNSKGLKGYKAKYVNASGQSPNMDIFFEVPNHPEYMIHLANGILDPAVFDKIVDSVNWGK